MAWCIQRRAHRKWTLTPAVRDWNRQHSKVRAKLEHIFHVPRGLWGYRKVRYRGLAKNEAHCLSLLALANLYLVRKDQLPLRA